MVKILETNEQIVKENNEATVVTDSQSYGEITNPVIFSSTRCVFCRGVNNLRAIYTDKATLEGYSLQGVHTKPHRDFKLPKHLELPDEWEIMVCDVCYTAIGEGLDNRASYNEWKEILRSELIRCECGKEISRSAIPKHLESNVHAIVMEIPEDERATYWESKESKLKARRRGRELKARCEKLTARSLNDYRSDAARLAKTWIKEYTTEDDLKAVAKIIRSLPANDNLDRVICPFCVNRQMLSEGISPRSVTNHIRTAPHKKNVDRYNR